ncbi:MAG: chaperonin GroES, partial [Thermoproteota archaeon]
MEFTPIHDRVLIKRIAEENKTAGGIIIPDNNQEKPSMGEVVAVGSIVMDNGDRRDLLVKKGDKVLFSKYAGTDVKVAA